MNELERLKQSEDAESMAVLVIGKMPENCFNCDGWEEGMGGDYCSYTEDIDRLKNMRIRHKQCPLRKAIAYIEPNGHVVYLREEEE